MEKSRKHLKAALFADENDTSKHSKLSRCSVCGKRFKSRSHFDAICNLCWADNEMKPYVAIGAYRGIGGGFGFVN